VVKLGVFCIISPPYVFARGTGNFGIKTGCFDARVVIPVYTRTAKSRLGLHASLFNTRTFNSKYQISTGQMHFLRRSMRLLARPPRPTTRNK
jgi:hypothetical protein